MISPLVSRHRLARLFAWARLWLMWFGGIFVQLIEIDRAHADEMTRSAARFVRELVILRAVQGVERPKFARGFGPATHRSGYMRAFIGARLRKRLAARDPVARFFSVLALIRDIEAETLRFSRRIARGITRRRGKPYASANDAIAGHAPRAIPAANSS